MRKSNILSYVVVLLVVMFFSKDAKSQKKVSKGIDLLLMYEKPEIRQKGASYDFIIKTFDSYLEVVFSVYNDKDPAFYIQSLDYQGNIEKVITTNLYKRHKKQRFGSRLNWMKKYAQQTIPITKQTEFVIVTSIVKGVVDGEWLPCDSYIIPINGGTIRPETPNNVLTFLML